LPGRKPGWENGCVEETEAEDMVDWRQAVVRYDCIQM
jgi:hypothetical protein